MDLGSHSCRRLVKSILLIMFEILDDNRTLIQELQFEFNLEWGFTRLLWAGKLFWLAHSHWSPKPFVVNTSRNWTTLECWNFFHISTTLMHLADCIRKPGKVQKFDKTNRKSQNNHETHYRVIFEDSTWIRLKCVWLCTWTTEAVVSGAEQVAPAELANDSCRFRWEHLCRIKSN